MSNIRSVEDRQRAWHVLQRVVACSVAVGAVLLERKTKGPGRLSSLESS